MPPRGGRPVTSAVLPGCPTVFIGAPAPPAPPPQGDPKPEDLPWVKFESVVSGDVVQVGVEGNIGGEVDISGKKGNTEGRVGAFAAALKGELPLKPLSARDCNARATDRAAPRRDAIPVEGAPHRAVLEQADRASLALISPAKAVADESVAELRSLE